MAIHRFPPRPRKSSPVILLVSTADRSLEEAQCRQWNVVCISKPIIFLELYEALIQVLGLAKDQPRSPARAGVPGMAPTLPKAMRRNACRRE